MRLLDNQSKQLLADFGLPLNQPVVVDSIDATVQAVRDLGQSAVLKAELEGVRFGHAAVMVEGGRGSVRGKAAALREAGVFVAETFDDILTGLAS